ncbi:MAG: hypothetical protein HY401_05245 [Elusimicrobia bacterium]|nr:hypothetical protein [Elusimicrobiota bacterium]
MEHKRTKSLGTASAPLITALYDENKTIFTIDDIVRINKVSRTTAAKLAFDLVKRSVISRLKSGKYIIIPQEAGSLERFTGNWLVAAREIANSAGYYIAFYSAMKHWGMTTQPLIKVFVATPKRQKPPKGMRDKICLVLLEKKYIWAVSEEWATKTEKVRISDLEKTLLDSLAYPQYCGGITEAAKGLWLVKEKIDFIRLLRYVKKYGKNIVAKRLGYLLEILEISKEGVLAELQKSVKNRYDLLDPAAGKTARGKNRWKLLDNIGKDQILKIISH